MPQIRMRKRDTPAGKIECPIGGTVDPNVTCLTCSFNCQRRRKNESVTLKGNELGWLIKLAEDRFNDNKLQESLKDLPAVRDAITSVLNKFHPNRFNAGGSDTVWSVVNQEKILFDVVEFKPDQKLTDAKKKQWRKQAELYLKINPTINRVNFISTSDGRILFEVTRK